MCANRWRATPFSFVPILSGSGVRVKLLEAFAAGIPVVSTRLGAEGLAAKDGEICALADDPQDFAERVVDLLRDPRKAAEMATGPARRWSRSGIRSDDGATGRVLPSRSCKRKSL